MLFIFLFIIIILLLIAVPFYYYKLIKRFLSFIGKEKLLKKHKKLFILLSIIFMLLSFNLFNMVGLFFMHFIFISLLIDLIYLCVKKIIKNKKIISLYNSSLIPLLLTILVISRLPITSSPLVPMSKNTPSPSLR